MENGDIVKREDLNIPNFECSTFVFHHLGVPRGSQLLINYLNLLPQLKSLKPGVPAIVSYEGESRDRLPGKRCFHVGFIKDGIVISKHGGRSVFETPESFDIWCSDYHRYLEIPRDKIDHVNQLFRERPIST